MPECATGARCPFRRPLLHRRQHHRHLLSPRLPGDAPAGTARALLRVGGRRRQRRLSPLPALPAGQRAGFARLDGFPNHADPSDPTDRQRRPPGRQRRMALRETGHRRALPAPAVPAPLRRIPQGLRALPPVPVRQEAASRDHAAGGRGRPRGLVRARSAPVRPRTCRFHRHARSALRRADGPRMSG